METDEKKVVDFDVLISMVIEAVGEEEDAMQQSQPLEYRNECIEKRRAAEQALRDGIEGMFNLLHMYQTREAAARWLVGQIGDQCFDVATRGRLAQFPSMVTTLAVQMVEQEIRDKENPPSRIIH